MGIAAAAALALGVGLFAARPSRAVAAAPAPKPAGAAPAAKGRVRAPAPSPAPAEAARAPSGDRRLARAEQALEAYLASAQYPPSCRPMAEKPDLVQPHHVSARTLPLAHRGEGASDRGRARVTLRQDRYYAAGDEAVTLGITCALDGAPSTCEVLSATAAPAPDMPPVAGPAPVSFADAGDGSVSAQVLPSALGFAAYHGPIRVTATVRVGGDDGEQGSASFDLEYTPAPPATFTGTFREALAGGSLDLYVGVQVARSGRYVVRARVEDARGRRFAYLSENTVLRLGAEEIRLQLFGKVVTDAEARAPFALRDLEGFLLEENTYPDREVMPGRDGVVYTTRAYDPGVFSPAEWDSETKDRRVHLLEQQLDVAMRTSNPG
jgi:hypothetical protein